MKEWIKEIITKRYELLSEEVGHKKELVTLKEQANTYENILLDELPEEVHRILIKWLEVNGHTVSIQNQWFYFKGVQDGLKLMIFLHNDERY